MIKSWYKKLSILVVCGMMVNACVSQPKAVQVIKQNRQSILNTPYLSHATHGVLLSSGLSQEQCLADFLVCVDKVNGAFMGVDTKNHLLIQAELYYAYAKYLKASINCQFGLQRPPIDQNFPNHFSQMTDDERQVQKQTNQACLSAYQTALLETLRYSYAYLFYDELVDKTREATPVVSEGQIRAQDLYHISTHDIIEEAYLGERGGFAFSDKYHQNQLANNVKLSEFDFVSRQLNQIYQIDSITPDGKKNQLHFFMTNDPDYMAMVQGDTLGAIGYLDSVYENRVSGMSVVSTRTGLGVGYVGSLTNRHQTTLQGFSVLKMPTMPQQTNQKNIHHKNHQRQSSLLHTKPKERIYPMQHLLLTGIITPAGKTLDAVLTTNQFYAQFYNPYITRTIDILGVHQPLYANFSSVYTKWLLENQFRTVGLASMFAKDSKLPELYMLEPYNPNKKVVVMIHGLASGPQTWVNLTNNLLADPTLRDNYQVWQVFYATNLPILENRYQIHRLIDAAFQMTDPKGKNLASKDVVIIGHSMGAIISRLLVSDEDLLVRLDTLGVSRSSVPKQSSVQGVTPEGLSYISTNHTDIKKLLKNYYRQDFDERFKLTALPQVGTAVFISAPHRGTDYADRWFTRAMRRAIHLPLDITQGVTGMLVDVTGAETAADHALGALYLQNGASQLSDKSAFIELTQDIAISPKVQYHSIMANNTGSQVLAGDVVSNTLSDGIVPYYSSHLDGAISETILTGGHSIHENPQTILHLRTILHQHLNNTNKKR